jgi:hypothetical protein
MVRGMYSHKRRQRRCPEKVYYAYRSLRQRPHAVQGHMKKIPQFLESRRREQRGRFKPESLLGFPWERQGKAWSTV